MNTFLPTIKKLSKGHPLQVYYRESELIQSILEKICSIDIVLEFDKYTALFKQMTVLKNRLERKEKYLLPYLEKYNWEGSSEAMRITHSILRNEIDTIHKFNSEKNIDKIAINLPFLIDGIKRLLTGEDMWLFPDALELLTDDDWRGLYDANIESSLYAELKNEYDYTSLNQGFTA